MRFKCDHYDVICSNIILNKMKHKKIEHISIGKCLLICLKLDYCFKTSVTVITFMKFYPLIVNNPRIRNCLPYFFFTFFLTLLTFRFFSCMNPLSSQRFSYIKHIYGSEYTKSVQNPVQTSHFQLYLFPHSVPCSHY